MGASWRRKMERRQAQPSWLLRATLVLGVVCFEMTNAEGAGEVAALDEFSGVGPEKMMEYTVAEEVGATVLLSEDGSKSAKKIVKEEEKAAKAKKLVEDANKKAAKTLKKAAKKAKKENKKAKDAAKKDSSKSATAAKKQAKKIVNDAAGKAKKAAAAAKKANAKVAAAVAKQKKAADAKALERAKKRASAASYKIPGPVTDYLKKLVKKQVRQGFAAAHGPIKGGSSQQRNDETLGEVNTLGMTDEEALLPAFKADQQKKGAGIALYGHQLVSKRCAGLNKQSCKNKIGCNWSLVPGDEDLPKADPSTSREKCVDAASWRCGVKKNFVDCVQRNKYGPSYVNWKFDGLCSSVMFDEKPKKRKLCSKGIRKRETCESNQDCPIFTGGGHAECKEYSAVAGCQVQAQQRCSAMGYQHVMQQV